MKSFAWFCLCLIQSLAVGADVQTVFHEIFLALKRQFAFGACKALVVVVFVSHDGVLHSGVNLLATFLKIIIYKTDRNYREKNRK